jgi:RHS repeat-associated protein
MYYSHRTAQESILIILFEQTKKYCLKIYTLFSDIFHLGSTSLITNLDGDVVQHVEYVPFGAVFIEERNNRWNAPYLFNAKALDEETELYYYGARYYDSRTSIWLRIYPMWEKYPGISIFAYCANNSVRYINPTRLAWRPTFDEDHDGRYNGYEWIPEDHSYDTDGNLLEGLLVFGV